MNIHEYQSKAILRGYGVNVPDGGAAFSVEEAVTARQAASNSRTTSKKFVNMRKNFWARRSSLTKPARQAKSSNVS